jgi:hypothetical protein
VGGKRLHKKRETWAGKKPRTRAHSIKDPENDHLSPFKTSVGRPSLRRDYLTDQRDNLISLLEPQWHEIGWELQCAKDAEGIRCAFEKGFRDSRPWQLAPLLRISNETATSKEIANTQRLLKQTGLRLRVAVERHQLQLAVCEEADRVASSVSQSAKRQLEQDRRRLRQNLRTLKIQISNTKAAIRKAEIKREKPSAVLDNTPLHRNLAKLEADHRADIEALNELQKRIYKITPERGAIAAAEATRQKEILISMHRRQNEASEADEKLRQKLLDQTAYFCRMELLKFIRDSQKRYAHDDPRSLANAIAGLPYITCRQSAALCAARKSNVGHFLSYEIFTFVKSAWAGRDLRKKSSIVEWFEYRIRNLAKFTIVEGHKRSNWVRDRLATDWHYLKRALIASLNARVHPRSMPYKITATFLRYSSTWDHVERLQAIEAKIAE